MNSVDLTPVPKTRKLRMANLKGSGRCENHGGVNFGLWSGEGCRDVALDTEDKGLAFFRKLVSFLYREVGAMRQENHPRLYSKSIMEKTGFARNRKARAKQIYQQTRDERFTENIIKPYLSETGLTIDDVYKIFRDGDWFLGRPQCSFGGPKWAEICKATIDLGNLIDKEGWAELLILIEKIRGLHHNHGLIADKFKEVE